MDEEALQSPPVACQELLPRGHTDEEGAEEFDTLEGREVGREQLKRSIIELTTEIESEACQVGVEVNQGSEGGRCEIYWA